MFTALGWATVGSIATVGVEAIGVAWFTGRRPSFWHWRPPVLRRADPVDLPEQEYIPWI